MPLRRNDEAQAKTPIAPAKPLQPPPGQRVDPDDVVEEASHESFPASDPPSFSPTRSGPPRPAGENPEPPAHSTGKRSKQPH